MLPIDIVLVRHGESEGNAAKRAMERGDPDILRQAFAGRHTSSFLLSDLGVRQALRTGEWLKQAFPDGFDRYYCSDYKRAMQTAGLLSLPNAQWRRNAYLVERDWGILDRLSDREREAQFAENMRTRDTEPFFWRPGESGESFLQVQFRLDRVLDTLHRECSDKTVIIVCHGEVMWAFRVLLERMSQERFRELHLSRDPDDRIHNCQIIHYSRRNPHNPRKFFGLDPHMRWVRMIRPTDDPVRDFGWQTFDRPTYSNAELLALTASIRRLSAAFPEGQN